MKVSGEAWVTVAIDDESCLGALLLAESLRRCMTNRKILVFVGPTVTKSARQNLQQVFDGVMKIANGSGENPEEVVAAAKHSCWSLPMPYQNCIFLDPKLLVIHNCDNLFDINGLGALSGDGDNLDTSLLIVKPSLDDFDSLGEILQMREKGKTMDDCIQHWLRNNTEFKILSNTYGLPVSMAGDEHRHTNPDILMPKIIKFVGDHPLDMVRKPRLGINLGTGATQFQQEIVKYWKELYSAVQSRFTLDGKIRVQPTIGVYKTEPIAIIGMSCRFPGANDLDEFWKVLVNGEDQMRPVPDNRWTPEDGLLTTPEERSIPAGFLKCAVDEFDSKFFGMSPLELTYMDPQQRLSLEVAWEALEDGGINPESLRGTYTGIYTGAWKTDYHELMTETGFRTGEFYRSFMGNAYGATAGRLAFMLGVTGSNVASESGCSSSVVALGLAVKSLRSHETNLSLVSGVNLLLHPFSFETMKAVISPDGRCKTFDADANGYGRAEGVGVIVLKRLSDAIRDGDRIYTLIRGYGEAQEGLSKSMGTPTAECETLAMEMALADAGIRPQEVSYVEAHGTGTPVGDPMEMEAVSRVYSRGRETPLMVGSVKTIIGHSESCSGLAGLIKTILAMENETIPPHINLNKINPLINLEKIPATIPVQAVPWKRLTDSTGSRRIAGISSYGLTGTDAHIIIEEPPNPSTAPKFTFSCRRPKEILTLSAKSEEALNSMIENYINFFNRNPTVSLSDVCFTANTGRAHLPHRVAVIGDSVADMVKKLQKRSFIRGHVNAGPPPPKLGFLFTGQGSQYHGMGQNLYDTNPIFRQSFDDCDTIFRSEYDVDIRNVMWNNDTNPELHRTINSQSSIFAIEYALLRLWESWGVTPDLCLGHSFGEVCAALAAGTMSLHQTAQFVVERARLVNNVSEGKMLVVKAGESRVRELLEQVPKESPDFWIDIATINSSDQTVVSGRERSILAFASFCETLNTKTHVLDATQAFHSRDMDVTLPPLKGVLDRILSGFKGQPPTPTCDYVSALYGRKLKPGEVLDIPYWLQHTRGSVRFVEASKAAYDTGCRLFLEIGAQPVLSALLTRNTDSGDGVNCFPSLRKKEDEWTTILTSLAKLYTQGVPINWKEFHKFYPGNKIRLPYYPFQRKRYWFTAPNSSPRQGLLTGHAFHPLVGTVFPNATNSKIYQNYIDLTQSGNGYLKDHALGKYVIFPGAGYLEMCLSGGHMSTLAAFEDFHTPLAPIVVEQLNVSSPLELRKEEGVEVQLINSSSTSSEDSDVGWSNLQIFSQQGESSGAKKWVSHASARFSPVVLEDTGSEINSLEETQRRMSSTIYSTTEFYETMALTGLNFGPIFKSLTQYRSTEAGDEFLVEVKVPQEEGSDKFLCHPVVLDAMVQSLLLGLTTNRLQIPVSIGKFVWYTKGQGSINYVHVFHQNSSEVGSDRGRVATLFDENGTKLGVMSKVQFIQTELESITKSLEKQKLNIPLLFEDNWRTTPSLGDPSDEALTLGVGHPHLNQTWVIFGGESQFEAGITKKLEECGRTVLKVRPDTKYAVLKRGEISVNPGEKDDIRKALRQNPGVEGVLYLFGLDEKLDQMKLTMAHLYLQQVILEFIKNPPKLVTITKGVIYVGDQGPQSFPQAGTLWGMSKTLRTEHSNIFCKCIDLDSHSFEEVTGVDQVFKDLWVDDKDYQIAYRDGMRYVTRLGTASITLNPLSIPLSNGGRFALVLPSSKSISDLKFGQMPKHLLKGKGCVEIQVKAAGLNFKDVLNVLKPDAQFDQSNTVGADYSGIVTRIGPDVTKFRVGDAVLGCNWEGGALPSHICSREDILAPLPKDWTFGDGATLATAFATAYYCLVTVSKLKRGQTILIHTASGAVGICAIQIAQEIGANIIATAGSRRKRAFLSRSMGVKHIFNSRTLDFGAGIDLVTQGLGVSCVLNSLTSSGFKETSLSACAPNAKFVEMSKLNIWQPSQVQSLRPDVTYTIVELSESVPETWTHLFRQLNDFLSGGRLKPIPYTRFDVIHIRDALSFLQKAKHVGKVVCVMPEIEQPKSTEGEGGLSLKNNLFNDRCTYLISGGLGGIGLEVAKWMGNLGAKYVVLCGRHPPGEKAEEVIKKLNESGMVVVPVEADVGKIEDCYHLVNLINNTLPPLRGVMHAAGCLADGLVVDQTREKFEMTFKGKVDGGWNLHQVTLTCNLEHFVVYSSIAAVLGMGGQSNYVACNAFLDSLTHYRHSLGLPATTINWGQWGLVGLAAELEIPGMTPFTPNQALNALELVMKSQRLQTVIIDGDVGIWKLLFSWASRYLEEVKVKVNSSTRGGEGSTNKMEMSSASFWEELECEKGSDERHAVVQKFVISVLQCILKLDDSEEFDVNQNFQDLGLDSLMMVELKNILQTLLGSRVNLSLGAITDCNTVVLLTPRLIELIYGTDCDNGKGKGQDGEERRNNLINV